jgi:hypothetical protein
MMTTASLGCSACSSMQPSPRAPCARLASRRPCSRACRARSRVVPQFTRIAQFLRLPASDVSHALASMVTVGSLPERKRATPRRIGRASVTAKSRLSDSRAGGSLIGKSLLETRAVPQFGQRHCCRLQIVPRVNEPANQSSRGQSPIAGPSTPPPRCGHSIHQGIDQAPEEPVRQLEYSASPLIRFLLVGPRLRSLHAAHCP